VGFVPFFDIGRVWASLLRFSGRMARRRGLGVRLIWSNRFIIRGDVSLTSDNVKFLVELGNNF